MSFSSPSEPTSGNSIPSEVDFTKTKSFLHGELSALGFSKVDLPVITSEKKTLRLNFQYPLFPSRLFSTASKSSKTTSKI
ncbi:hypothetical protein LEP1GSC123_3027 [Leptospira borgpetersenii str. 200701203]|uniref:Uncharacterized protein n=1 Tax=Leptospira borgpetersenii str. 200701203 TaxID=1193007 RepID=M3HL02_LEPBO|nr:hypothetical protein LEP1GSC123_3027 [Leptospira borgpetersenii str. 200701203]